MNFHTLTDLVAGQLDRSTLLHPDRDLGESRDILPSPFAHVFHPKALVLVLKSRSNEYEIKIGGLIYLEYV
jgi:hypothetical protein